MQVPNVPGKLIALEGLDGSGQTTQGIRLASWLTKRGYEAIYTKEPTDGPAGSLIRLVLARRVEFDDKTLAMLFLADRMDHQLRRQSSILQLLQHGRALVVSDRYYLSSYAYQVLDPSIDIEWLGRIHAKCLVPTLTVYIDVPPATCIHRITVNRGHRFELFEAESQLEQIRQNYFKAIQHLRERGENVQVVNGKGTPHEVMTRIRSRVEAVLVPGLPPDQAQLILDRHPSIVAFRESVLAADLQILNLRRIAYGYQVRVADSGDLAIPVNFFDSGKIKVQGREGQLKQTVQELAQQVADQTPGTVAVVSNSGEDGSYVQEGLL